MKKVGESEEDYIEVEESHCDNRIRPKDTNYCHVPCPGHCVLSNWTPWSVCPQVSGGPLVAILLTWINPAWISNGIRRKACDEITYPFPNFNSSILGIVK